MPDFVKIAEPVTRVMGKKKYSWVPEQDQAFETLKNKLVNHPCLRRPILDKPFLVHCDASDVSVAGIADPAG